MFMLLLILYSCVSVPFRLGMSHFASGGWWVAEAAISVAFIVDIVLNHQDGSTAYSDWNLIQLSIAGPTTTATTATATRTTRTRTIPEGTAKYVDMSGGFDGTLCDTADWDCKTASRISWNLCI